MSFILARSLPRFLVVTIYDILVIYLACGAPVAVSRYIGGGDLSLRRAIRSIWIGLFWIWLVPGYFHTRLKGLLRQRKLIENSSEPFPGSNRLIGSIDAVSNSSQAYPGVFRIRESVGRYLGIAALADSETAQGDKIQRELFEVAGHPSPEIASICLSRRNRDLVASHHSDAAAELLELCRRITDDSDRPSDVIDAFERVFRTARDEDGLSQLQLQRAAYAERTAPEVSIKEEKLKWDTSAILPSQKKRLNVRLKALTLMSSLRNDD